MTTDREPRDIAAATAALLAASLDGASAREPDRLAAMNGMCATLARCMARWIGADGWEALLKRAVADVAGDSGEAPLVVERDGLLAWRRQASNDDARPLFLAVLEAAVQVLERFIGVEMTATLVEQALAVDGGSRQGDSDEQ